MQGKSYNIKSHHFPGPLASCGKLPSSIMVRKKLMCDFSQDKVVLKELEEGGGSLFNKGFCKLSFFVLGIGSLKYVSSDG